MTAGLTTRDFVQWAKGAFDFLGEEPPSKAHWAKWRTKVDELEQGPDYAPDHAASARVAAPVPPLVAMAAQQLAAHQQPPNPEVDPDPRGGTVVRKWRMDVMKELEELGFDPESAAEMLGNASFVEDLNVMPKAMANRIKNGSF